MVFLLKSFTLFYENQKIISEKKTFVYAVRRLEKCVGVKINLGLDYWTSVTYAFPSNYESASLADHLYSEFHERGSSKMVPSKTEFL